MPSDGRERPGLTLGWVTLCIVAIWWHVCVQDIHHFELHTALERIWDNWGTPWPQTNGLPSPEPFLEGNLPNQKGCI